MPLGPLSAAKDRPMRIDICVYGSLHHMTIKVTYVHRTAIWAGDVEMESSGQLGRELPEPLLFQVLSRVILLLGERLLICVLPTSLHVTVSDRELVHDATNSV